MWCLVTNAGRRRTVVHAARDRKARPDVATGGDPTAMTMRVVGEAVEPRARTYIYAHKNQGLHKRDKLREQLRHGLKEQCCGSCFAPRAGDALCDPWCIRSGSLTGSPGGCHCVRRWSSFEILTDKNPRMDVVTTTVPSADVVSVASRYL